MRMHPDVAAAMNDQVRKEFASAYLYLSMAAWFESQALSGFGHWMRLQAKEEEEHAMKLFDFLLERGEKVALQAIEQPQVDFDSAMQIVEMVAEHEAKVTASIHAVYGKAVEHKDYATQAHLDWFVTEQVEEEDMANDLLDKMKMAGDRPGNLLFLDHRLSKRKDEDHD